MAIFNFFGESEHRVFNYKPIYYDPEKEELKKKFGAVDGTKAKEQEKIKENYTPGAYIKGSLRDGNYSMTRSHSNKAQNIIGIIGLILVFVVLGYIAKFYSLL